MSDNDVLHLHRGPVYPPSDGGEKRIWETAKKLSEFGTVWLAHPCEDDLELPSGIEAVDVDNAFMESKPSRIYAWNAFLSVSEDNVFDRLQARSTVRTLERSVVQFDVICCECPQMLRASYWLSRRFDAPLLVNMHNAMFDLLDQQLGSKPIPKFLRARATQHLKKLEQWGIDEADAVVFQSERDRASFDLPNDTLIDVITNGTDFAEIDDGGGPERLRNRLGISKDATVCLFVGAYDYQPNGVAGEIIIDELAPELPEVEFLLVGRNPPATDRRNVHTPGFVENLPDALSLADVAICPLTLGSGTKLKMMDYLAAGLPIVTTEVGAQGIPLADEEAALIRDVPDGFVDAIRELRDSETLRASLSTNAKELGREYSWETLLEGYEPIMRTLLNER
jgi:glycosyltransferase involved in cell wall biosynthesis